MLDTESGLPVKLPAAANDSRGRLAGISKSQSNQDRAGPALASAHPGREKGRRRAHLPT